MKNKNTTPKSTVAVRVVALLLALLMIIGGAYYAIISILSVFASPRSESISGNEHNPIDSVCADIRSFDI